MILQPYLHASRHKHAARRIRGAGGRFLNSDEARAFREQSVAGPPPSLDSADPDAHQSCEQQQHDEQQLQARRSQPPQVTLQEANQLEGSVCLYPRQAAPHSLVSNSSDATPHGVIGLQQGLRPGTFHHMHPSAGDASASDLPPRQASAAHGESVHAAAYGPAHRAGMAGPDEDVCTAAAESTAYKTVAQQGVSNPGAKPSFSLGSIGAVRVQ